MVALPPVARGVEDLVVEVDVLDVERDVLLGFPVDRLGQLGLGHHRQRDLLDDHRVARERGGDLLGLDLPALEQPAHGGGDGGAVDDRAVDDAVGRNGLGAEGHDLVALADRLQLDGLDGARSEVEPDERLGSVETPRCPVWKEVALGGSCREAGFAQAGCSAPAAGQVNCHGNWRRKPAISRKTRRELAAAVDKTDRD